MPRAGLDSEAVVAAAAALADAEGLRSLTLARLAERLDVRSPSLYAHVGGLEDLRARLATRGARELAAALQAAAAGRARTDALHAVADAYRTYAHAHPGTYAAIQRAPGNEPDPAPKFAAAAAEVVEVLVAVLRGYELHDDDAIHAVRIMRAALHGFVSLEREGGFAMPIDVDESYRRLVNTLDHGLGLVAPMSVAVKDHREAARYELTAEGERIGFVNYRLDPEVITFLHAEVNPAREGEGWGSRLVAGALDDARARGLKVRPVCPFVAFYIERHPDYHDLLA